MLFFLSIDNYYKYLDESESIKLNYFQWIFLELYLLAAAKNLRGLFNGFYK